MQEIPGGVTQALGFEAAGVAAAIKYQNRRDMAIIYSETPAVVAGAFTRNVVRAAPVEWDEKIVRENDHARCIIVNAGIANACTGPQGMKDCESTAHVAARLLNINTNEVLLCSTGVIGMTLPMEKIEAGVCALVQERATTEAAGTDAARAIMTTDTVAKEVAIELTLGGKNVTIGGMCKGSGMIHPNMATMLAFVTTDVAITKELLTESVNEIVADTYNMVSVDGDTSTSDSLLLLANGRAENPLISSRGADYELFKAALYHVNEQLAQMIAADGEGATTFITVKVSGARSKDEARRLAKSVAASSLVKTAIYGNDANWGRIICALGYAGVEFNPATVTLVLESEAGSQKIYENGAALCYSEELATQILAAGSVLIDIHVHMGTDSATAWGCDLTYDYVKINADYRT